MNPNSVYLRAIEVLRTNGHTQGEYYATVETGVGIEFAPAECPVCLSGALSVAFYGYPVPPEKGQRPEFDVLAERLATALGIDRVGGPPEDDDPVMRLAGWNDQLGRTVDELIAGLQAVTA